MDLHFSKILKHDCEQNRRGFGDKIRTIGAYISGLYCRRPAAAAVKRQCGARISAHGPCIRNEAALNPMQDLIPLFQECPDDPDYSSFFSPCQRWPPPPFSPRASSRSRRWQRTSIMIGLITALSGESGAPAKR